MAYIISPPVNGQLMNKTSLVFCASYEDGTSARRELHEAYEAYLGWRP